MALDNGWVRIETESGTGSTAVSATVLKKNTGRSDERSVTLVGVNAHGETATATIKQDPADLFIVVDHYEDDNGDDVSALGNSYAKYYIVGYSNVDWMTAEETSDKEYTDMNDVQQSEVWHNGFIVTEQSGSGDSHTVNLETSMTYGTDEQYMFRIPFFVYDNNTETQRNVSFEIRGDESETVVAVTTIIQKESTN